MRIAGAGTIAAAALAAAIAAAPASAGTLRGVPDGYMFTDDTTGSEVVAVSVDGASSTAWKFTAVRAIQLLDDAARRCSHSSSSLAVVSCPRATTVIVDLGAGDDRATVQPGPGSFVTVTGGAGNDVIGGRADGMYLYGNSGNDQLWGGAGKDVIAGADGDDEILASAGDDEVTGGAGTDRVRGTSSGETISLNDIADDGIDGARANYASDIEEVYGGAGNDQIVGSDGPNLLDGEGGTDTIDGRRGRDILERGAGGDTLLARDSEADTIDCGADADTATVDEADAPSGCESVHVPSPAPEPSPTAGATAEPTPDPGGTATARVDSDGDGFPDDVDCGDFDPAVSHRAREIPGNSVDENCDDVIADYPKLPADFGYRWTHLRNGIRASTWWVENLPANGEVAITCRGKRCPRRAWRLRPKDGSVNVLRALRARVFAPGSVVEVRITAPRTIGHWLQFAVRKRGRWAKAVERKGCLRPGAAKPVPCRKGGAR